jgi:argininosuccinate synthase
MEINKDNLEKSLGEGKKTPAAQPQANENQAPQGQAPQMPKEMEIGFLQGALNTLANERIELIKMIQNVEKIMGMHIQRLEQLGVKVQTNQE